MRARQPLGPGDLVAFPPAQAVDEGDADAAADPDQRNPHARGGNQREPELMQLGPPWAAQEGADQRGWRSGRIGGGGGGFGARIGLREGLAGRIPAARRRIWGA